MRAHVHPQGTGHACRVFAQVASIWPGPYVHAHDVLMQQALGGEVSGTMEARQVVSRGLHGFLVNRLKIRTNL